MSDVRYLCLIAALWMVATQPAAAFEYPRDPDGTLDAVKRSGTIRVGVSENPPWVTLDGASPDGVEVRLLAAFADELGVTVKWHEVSALRALDGVEQGALDLAIGGFDLPSVTAHSGVAPSYVYVTETVVVAADPTAPIPETIEGLRVFVPQDVFAATALRGKDAVPVASRDDARYEAIPSWQVPARGLVPTGITLLAIEHVLVVPQGENAWLMRLERFMRQHEGAFSATREGSSQ